MAMIGSRIMKRALVAFGLVIPVLVMAGCHYPERLSTKGEQRGTHIVMITNGRKYHSIVWRKASGYTIDLTCENPRQTDIMKVKSERSVPEKRNGVKP
jgi:hypothetical protein